MSTMTVLSVFFLFTTAAGMQLRGDPEMGPQMPEKTLDHTLKVQDDSRSEKGGKTLTSSQSEKWAAGIDHHTHKPSAAVVQVDDGAVAKAKAIHKAKIDAVKAKEAKTEDKKHPILDCDGTMLPLGAKSAVQRYDEMVASPDSMVNPEFLSAELCWRLEHKNQDRLFEILDPILSRESNFHGEHINVVDIGSRFGAVSMKMAKYKSVGQVYTFHPQEAMCEYIEKVIELNVLQGKDERQVRKLKVFRKKLWGNEGSGITGSNAPEYTIDNMVKNKELANIGLLHIENNHVKALTGASQLIRTQHPIIVTEASLPGKHMSFQGHDLVGLPTDKSSETREVLEFLKEAGYRSYSVDEKSERCRHNSDDNTYKGRCASFVHLPKKLAPQFAFFDHLVQSRTLQLIDSESVRVEHDRRSNEGTCTPARTEIECTAIASDVELDCQWVDAACVNAAA